MQQSKGATVADWETFYSCGRCGSDVQFEPCGFCIGCGYSEDNPDPGCPHCKGEGFVGVCVSSADWCLAHPLSIERPGERHSVVEYQELDLRAEESSRHV